MRISRDKIIILVLAILLGASLITGGLGVPRLIQKLSADRVAKNTIDFVNKNLLPSGIEASLISASAGQSGLYSVKFKVVDREYDAYVSADGKLLFPEGIVLKTSTKKATSAGEIPKKDKADLKLFVMSFCPYGNQAENLMKQVVDLLGDKANIEVHYIISKEGNNYNSLHGKEELDQDVIELCIQKYFKDKYWNFISQVNTKTTLETVAKKWEGIAKALGIDTSKIKTCATKERNSFLNSEIALSEKYSASGSPTIVINDTTYEGDRTANAYKEAICAGFKNPPAECNKKLSDEAESTSSEGCGK